MTIVDFSFLCAYPAINGAYTQKLIAARSLIYWETTNTEWQTPSTLALP